MSTNKFSIGAIINESWSAIKKNVWIFAGVLLGFLLIVFTVSFIMGGSTSIAMSSINPNDIFALLAVFYSFSFLALFLIFFVLEILFYVGYYKMALIAADGLEPSLSAFSASIRKMLNILLAAILFGILMNIGMLLCIIPGIIVAVRLRYFLFFIIDKDRNAIDSITESWEITKGETWKLVLLDLSLFLINIAGMICCGIGLLVTFPMTIIAYALVYRKLTEEVPQNADFDTLSDTENRR